MYSRGSLPTLLSFFCSFAGRSLSEIPMWNEMSCSTWSTEIRVRVCVYTRTYSREEKKDEVVCNQEPRWVSVCVKATRSHILSIHTDRHIFTCTPSLDTGKINIRLCARARMCMCFFVCSLEYGVTKFHVYTISLNSSGKKDRALNSQLEMYNTVNHNCHAASYMTLMHTFNNSDIPWRCMFTKKLCEIIILHPYRALSYLHFLALSLPFYR